MKRFLSVGICILALLALSVVLAGCQGPAVRIPPPARVKLPNDVPVPMDFGLAAENPVPRTSYAGRRFARYALIKVGEADAPGLVQFLQAELKDKGWHELESSKLSEDGEWFSRWSNDKDLLVLNLNQDKVYRDEKWVALMRLKVEINAE